MSKMEEFENERRKTCGKDIELLVNHISNGIVEVEQLKQNINYGVADDTVDNVLKVARSKTAEYINNMTALLEILEKMYTDSNYLDNAEPSDVEKEIEKINTLFEEDERGI